MAEPPRTMPPRYAFRVGDLRAWHEVTASCGTCRHTAVIGHERLKRGRPDYTRLTELEFKLRCKRCKTRGTAVLSFRKLPR